MIKPISNLLDFEVSRAAVKAYLATSDADVYRIGLEWAKYMYDKQTAYIQQKLEDKRVARKKLEDQKFFQDLFEADLVIAYLENLFEEWGAGLRSEQLAVQASRQEKNHKRRRDHDKIGSQLHQVAGPQSSVNKTSKPSLQDKVKTTVADVDKAIAMVDERYQAYMERLDEELAFWKAENQEAIEKEAETTAANFAALVREEARKDSIAEEKLNAVIAASEREVKEALVHQESNARVIRLGVGSEAYKAAIVAEKDPIKAAEAIIDVMDLKKSLTMQIMLLGITRNLNIQLGRTNHNSFKRALDFINSDQIRGSDQIQGLIKEHQNRLVNATEPAHWLAKQCLEARNQFEDTLASLNRNKEELLTINSNLSLFGASTLARKVTEVNQVLTQLPSPLSMNLVRR